MCVCVCVAVGGGVLCENGDQGMKGYKNIVYPFLSQLVWSGVTLN